jgi:hypothetical protein
MTAKALLHRRVDDMSEEEAEFFLGGLFTDQDFEFPPLSPEDMARIDRALEQDRQGRVVRHEEFLRRFGLQQR